MNEDYSDRKFKFVVNNQEYEKVVNYEDLNFPESPRVFPRFNCNETE